MTHKIFSVKTAKRLFLEDSFDLVLCHPNMIDGASKEFESEGNHAASSDIYSRYDEMNQEMAAMVEEARREFC